MVISPLFIARHTHFALTDWVQNPGREVAIHVEGREASLQEFADSLPIQAPPLARPRLLESSKVPPRHDECFFIKSSDADTTTPPHLPPDQFVCDDGLKELGDPHDRRYRYPFINCTQCGPRDTLIAGMPCDRQRTGMAGSPLCLACRSEYETHLPGAFMPSRWHARNVDHCCASPAARNRFRGIRPHSPLAQRSDGLWPGGWTPLLPHLCNKRIDVGKRAAGFHALLAWLILRQAEKSTRAIQHQAHRTVRWACSRIAA